MTSARNGTVRAVSDSRQAAHRNAVAIQIGPLVEFLNENLSAGLVGLLAGVDPQTARRWARGDGLPRTGAERRLRSAYQVFQTLMPYEAPATVRAWFMGMNPQLDDESPAEAIAADRFRDVMAAARAFAHGG
jgi:hypothetical protein